MKAKYIPTYDELAKQGYSLEVADHIIDGCWYLITDHDWAMRTESAEISQIVMDYVKAWGAGKDIRKHILSRRGKRITCVYGRGE